MGARYEARKQLLTPQSNAVIMEFERRLQSSLVPTTQQRNFRPVCALSDKWIDMQHNFKKCYVHRLKLSIVQPNYHILIVSYLSTN